ncbi:MAG: PorT family protein [Bacteroidetes bacterium]|nr:PorT family protein [Bacteroidota bacterium]
MLTKRISFTAILCIWGAVTYVHAQTQHHPFYDIEKKLHFGFSLGTNFSDLKLSYKDNYYPNDTLMTVDVGLIPGITLGAICNFHLTERLDLRIIPSLLLTQRNLIYTFGQNDIRNKTTESVYANLPVLIKYKSVRHNNFRLYTIAGGEYSYDIASKAGASKDYFDPDVAFKPHNFSYTWGVGCDFYFPYFKFSPEIRVANGLNNLLDPHETVYSDSFSKIRNRMIVLSMHFE